MQQQRVMPGKLKTAITLTAAIVLIAAVGWGVWQMAGRLMTARHSGGASKVAKHPPDPLLPVAKAYNAHRYKDAEVEAKRIINAAAGSKDPKARKDAVRARYIMAFSAARQKNLKLARERFSVLREEASKLPDKGKQKPQQGTATPTLEEEAAYQHAVCTAALGDKKAGEAEYMAFMRDYPESPLTGAAAERIRWLHDGHMPKSAQDAWTKASKIARARDEARRKAQMLEMSKCGPECLSEFLHRHGIEADPKTLGDEMKTGVGGTSLFALVNAAKKRGLPAKGLALTPNGLAKQPLPLIAFIQPGHYVILESVTPTQVTIWDAYAGGVGKPGTRTLSKREWGFMWRGVALVVSPSTARDEAVKG